ncbi:inorganic phosphate transporter [Candidatus Micrarchaeota archaeon]|nr:inorganic phosphate transporter [Candidatus Micrarchaeota archaeon]
MIELVLLAAIGMVLLWTFWSGFSDASNAITTVVATRVLTPMQAVALAAAGNLVGLFLGEAVATTIGKGLIDAKAVSGTLVIIALLAGMVWEYITYKRGIPISETQVLLGTLAGAAIAAQGIDAVNYANALFKVIIPMALAPLIAFIAVLAFTAIALRAIKKLPLATANNFFKRLQILSSLFFSITHGANDGQKSIGVIMALTIFYGIESNGETATLLKIITFAALSLGTLFGGWRIVKTMGFKLAKMKPWQGFCAETSAALVVGGASAFGFPLSTSQAVSGSIMGASAAKGTHAIRATVAREILIGWLLTIPASVLLGFTFYKITAIVLGTI